MVKCMKGGTIIPASWDSIIQGTQRNTNEAGLVIDFHHVEEDLNNLTGK